MTTCIFNNKESQNFQEKMQARVAIFVASVLALNKADADKLKNLEEYMATKDATMGETWGYDLMKSLPILAIKDSDFKANEQALTSFVTNMLEHARKIAPASKFSVTMNSLVDDMYNMSLNSTLLRIMDNLELSKELREASVRLLLRQGLIYGGGEELI